MTDNLEDDIAIVKSSHSDIVMMRPSLVVLAVPHKAIPKIAWWLQREYGQYSFEEKRCNELDISLHSTPDGIRRQKGFGLVLYDDDGLTLIFEAKKIATVRYLLRPEEYTLSPFCWKAFMISMRGSAVEVPGAVYCLANALSNERLSILHISTFDSEVFLIQEPDLERACKILKEFDDPRRIMNILESRYHELSVSSERNAASNTGDEQLVKGGSSSSPLTNLREEEDEEKNGRRSSNGGLQKSYFYEADQSTSMDNDDEDRINLDLSWITPQVKSTISFPQKLSEAQILSAIPSKTKFDEGFALCVLPSSMIMAKCSGRDMRICSDIMIKMILFDERYSKFSSSYSTGGTTIEIEAVQTEPTLKHEQSEYFLPSEDSVDTSESDKRLKQEETSKQSKLKTETDRANFMFGMWFAHDEVTFLIHDNDLGYFPEDQLTISPQQWKAIKLCGRPIAFNETGVVSAMSQIDTNIPSLNISTAQTNCTLVPYELLSNTVDGLAVALNCPWHITSNP